MYSVLILPLLDLGMLILRASLNYKVNLLPVLRYLLIITLEVFFYLALSITAPLLVVNHYYLIFCIYYLLNSFTVVTILVAHSYCNLDNLVNPLEINIKKDLEIEEPLLYFIYIGAVSLLWPVTRFILIKPLQSKDL